MFYFVKTPWFLKKIYPDFVWEIDSKEKTIYLSFDDGPHDIATPFILDELKKPEEEMDEDLREWLDDYDPEKFDSDNPLKILSQTEKNSGFQVAIKYYVILSAGDLHDLLLLLLLTKYEFY